MSAPILRWQALPKGARGKATVKNNAHEGANYESGPAAMTPRRLVDILYRQGYHTATVTLRGDGEPRVVGTISAPDDYGRRTTWVEGEPTTTEAETIQ